MPRAGEQHTPQARTKIAIAQQDAWDNEARREAQADRMRQHWADPEFRAKQAQGRLERKARDLGTTVERLLAPPLPRKGRKAALKALFWEGKDVKAVVALHPRVPYSEVTRAKSEVTVEWFNRTGLFGLPADHLEVLELL